VRKRSTVVAAFAVVWMGAIIARDALDGVLSGHSIFAGFVLVVGVLELAKAVRARRAEGA